MSANRLKTKESGFTLIEVTLAIVIGVVVIAGATVLYNQAKSSAANSAAQGKVNAAAATVEEFAAKNFGRYPDGTQFATLWQRARGDDFASSPWGGPTGETDGVITGAALAGLDAAASDALGIDPARVGSLEYRRPALATDNATKSVYDRQSLSTKDVRNYGIWIYDGNGAGPNFVTGGK